MFEKLTDKLWALNDVFEEYPRVFYLSVIYMVLIGVTISIYFPVLKWLVNFEIFFNYSFREVIISNFDTLRWGVVVLPLVIALFGFFDVIGLHDRLKKRKYGR
ncbi:hypothetical protein MID07_04305 [Acinetobacter seifertii]|uniref:hypothetical protein n=1 Tax=Acinetobacter seifertii TaxID=1530123 RepID=UPI001F031A02|nr:hypothetical protein [Acinetobacter seifertii]MCG8283852.1 hypothetical protein [Acinetobacter seifertii]